MKFVATKKMKIQTGRSKTNKDDYEIRVSKEGDLWNYECTINTETISTVINKTEKPSKLKDNSEFIRKVSNEGRDVEETKKKLRKTLKGLEHEILKQEKKAQLETKKTEEDALNNIISNGEKVYGRFRDESINVPQYLASISRWFIAGEESNVIKLILAILSTTKGHAINMISESASGTGKSEIEKTAFRFFHDRHYINLNHTTPASFKNLCQDNPHIFKNKVVRLGDLGTEANSQALEEVRGILKILNSEGKYDSTKMDTNNQDIIKIKLEGHTALSYTKVPNSDTISEQELSRGITYNPDPKNNDIFKRFLTWKTTPNFYDNTEEKIQELIGEMKNYLEYLINLDIEILNPFSSQIIDLLENNKVFRRLASNELLLINAITLLNLPKKEIHELDNKRLIIVSCEDMVNYMVLFREHLEANVQYEGKIENNRLFDRIKEDYIPINDYEDNKEFQDELSEAHLTNYEDVFTEKSNRFFTIKSILHRYRGSNELKNVLPEGKDENAEKNKLRRIFKDMPDKIGIYKIDPKHNNRPTPPDLYYVIKKPQDDILNTLVLDINDLSRLKSTPYEPLITRILEDFKSFNPEAKVNKVNDRLSKKFNHDFSIFDQHPNIDLPDYLKDIPTDDTLKDFLNQFEDEPKYRQIETEQTTIY